MLEVTNLGRDIGGTPHIQDVSFSLKEGERLAVIGPRGSGKSLLLRILGGTTEADRGEMIFRAEPLHLKKKKAALTLGYMPAAWPLPEDLSVRESLLYCATLRYQQLSLRALQSFCTPLGLVPLLSRRVYELSPLQRQWINLLQACLHRPALLLLDDPLKMLDPYEANLWLKGLELIAGRSSMIMSSQDPERILALSHHLLILSRGRSIFSGTRDEYLRLGNPNQSFLQILQKAEDACGHSMATS